MGVLTKRPKWLSRRRYIYLEIRYLLVRPINRIYDHRINGLSQQNRDSKITVEQMLEARQPLIERHAMVQSWIDRIMPL